MILVSYHFRNDGNGCMGLQSHLGVNGFASANFDFAMCSDGGRFNFVPVASALDYGNLTTQALDLDIEGENINTKLNTVAAGVDVMIGYADGLGNREHLNMRNDGIRNITRTIPPFPDNEETYFSCLEPSGNPGTNRLVRRAMLNLDCRCWC